MRADDFHIGLPSLGVFYNIMKDRKKVYDIRVKVGHYQSTTPIDTDTKQISRVDGYWKASNRTEPVKAYYSLNELAEYINSYSSNGQKKDSKVDHNSLLKGIYKGGTSGVDLVKTSNLLPFDVDVKRNGVNDAKKDENLSLLDAHTRESFRSDFVDSTAVMWFASKSGNGTGGFLYVEGLDELEHKDKAIHKKVSDAVIDYIAHHNILNGATLDEAQGRFRQIRNFNKQAKEVRVNPLPVVFTYEVIKTERKHKNGTAMFELSPEDFAPTEGSSEYFFEKECTWDFLLTNSNHTRLQHSDTRYSHRDSGSSSSGAISEDGSVYYQNSSSVKGGQSTYGKLRFLVDFIYNGDKKKANAWISKRYKSMVKEAREERQQMRRMHLAEVLNLKNRVQTFRKESAERGADINTTISLRIEKYAEMNALVNAKAHIFTKDELRHCLGITDLSIPTDTEIRVSEYISEKADEILSLSGKYNRLLVYATTGLGKNHFVSNRIHEVNPDARVLVVAPLTAIAEQQGALNEGSVVLTGNSTEDDFAKAKTAKLVFATQEQASKEITYSKGSEDRASRFDFIIIDEIHDTIKGLDYKREPVNKLLNSLDDTDTVIALSGTPSPLSQMMGFHVVKIDKVVEKPSVYVLHPSVFALPIDERFPRVKVNTYINNDKDIERLGKIFETSPFLSRSLVNTKKGVEISNDREAMEDMQYHSEGKVIIRLNNIQAATSFSEAMVRSGLYSKEELVILNSGKKGLEYDSLIDDQALRSNTKVLFTTSLIDCGVNIKDLDVKEMWYVSNRYGENPSAIRQSFGRLRLDTTEVSFNLMLKSHDDKGYRGCNYKLEYESMIHKLRIAERLEGEKNEYSVFNNDKYYKTDGSVNEYQVVNVIDKKFFESLTLEEYFHYMDINYMMSVIIKEMPISLSTPEVSDAVTVASTTAKNHRKQLAEMYSNDRDEFLRYAHTILTSNSVRATIKSAMSDTTPKITKDGNIKELFRRQKKFVADKIKLISRLEKSGVDIGFLVKRTDTVAKNGDENLRIVWRAMPEISKELDFADMMRLSQRADGKSTKTDDNNRASLKEFSDSVSQSIARASDSVLKNVKATEVSEALAQKEQSFSDKKLRNVKAKRLKVLCEESWINLVVSGRVIREIHSDTMVRFILANTDKSVKDKCSFYF